MRAGFRTTRRAPAIAALFVLGLHSVACSEPDAPPGLRIVLITLDTLRFDHFEGEHAGMPLTLERANRGTRFSRFYVAAPITQPTHSTIFTGRQPWEHGVTRNGLVLSDRVPSIVESLKAAGFATRAVVASFPLTARFGFARGFDEFTQDFEHRFNPEKNEWADGWDVPEGRFFALGDAITRRAIESLDRADEARQFFWFHYFDAHSPYGSTRGSSLRKPAIMKAARGGAAVLEAALERARSGYRDDVAYLDAALERVFVRLDRDRERFETHVLVVGDHGESLGEGGSIGHGQRLSEEQLRVPAFILSPKLAPGERRDPAGSVDVARTLLSLAGIATDELDLGGRDLTRASVAQEGVFCMRQTFAKESHYETRLDGSRVLMQGNLFCAVEADGSILRGNRSGLALDTTAVTRRETAAQERALAHFATFEARLDAAEPAPPLDRETREGLEALGYVE